MEGDASPYLPEAWEVPARSYSPAEARADGDFAQAVLHGLSRRPRAIPCRFFHDARGSELFEEITKLAEYYPTRAETALLETYGLPVSEQSRAEPVVGMVSRMVDQKGLDLIAAIAGALPALATFVVLGGYGLAVLPTNAYAVGLLVFSMFGFGIDVQTGVPRVWTGIASVAYLLGSVLLYDGRSLSWITLLVSVLGMVLAMLAGMPAMVRSRFSTPTIGREWMVGEEGVATTAVDPDGTVLVRDAPWRARTNRATPIPDGAPVRVAAIDGLVLEVETLEGAARDHRERTAR